jgi:hypothetical protein
MVEVKRTRYISSFVVEEMNAKMQNYSLYLHVCVPLWETLFFLSFSMSQIKKTLLTKKKTHV